jgi:hypothetical protein
LMQQNQFILRSNNNLVNGRVEASRQIHWTQLSLLWGMQKWSWVETQHLSCHECRYYIIQSTTWQSCIWRYAGPM